MKSVNWEIWLFVLAIAVTVLVASAPQGYGG